MQTRRNFLQQGSALALGTLLLNKSVAAELFNAGKFPAPGLQLFTFFNVIEQDVPGTLKKIHDIGYREIESAFSRLGGYYGKSPKEFAQLLKDLGLTWRSHHVLGAPFKLPPGSKMPTGADGKPMVIPPMKNEINLPIDFHTHCTPGYGLASCLVAMINGVDILDTNIITFAGGPAAPSYEIIRIFADKLGIDTGVNLEAVMKIDHELRTIRQELAAFDCYKQFPIEFDFLNSKLPESVDKLFDVAIELAKNEQNKEDELLNVIHLIEEYFNFIAPDEAVKAAEIPGGMYTNMLAQLKQLKLEHLLPKVLETVPMVRIECGCPPLVTPTSQIVGAQAVNCVIDKINDKPFYTNVSNQFFNLVKGSYGCTPTEIEPAFRLKITGESEAIPYDTSKYKKQENPMILEKFGGVKLAANEKEELLMELFPTVAQTFLKNKKEQEMVEIRREIACQKAAEIEKQRAVYQNMSAEEKQKRLLKGLENYNWGSVFSNPVVLEN
jgi:pyruvate/oxaloacetate carboxyltransferase